MGLSAAEQYFLELINRARLDPRGEVKRLEAASGDGVSGTLSIGSNDMSAMPKRSLDPLAGNNKLARAAEKHVDWMMQTGRFSHTGDQGSSAGLRINLEGYKSKSWAENIAFRGLTEKASLKGHVDILHRNLFESDGHRANLLSGGMREVGTSVGVGDFQGLDAAMTAQNFARGKEDRLLTGVAYRDADKDGFYSMGEGKRGVDFKVAGNKTDTARAGGYSVSLGADGKKQTVTVGSGKKQMRVQIEDKKGNVKLDLIGNDTLASSSSLKLGAGAKNAVLLGIDKLSLKGNGKNNKLTGNDTKNLLSGGKGKDKLFGDGGADHLRGQQGRDKISGGDGKDRLVGGGHNDRLRGNDHADVLKGGAGRDRLDGGDGSDKLLGGRGKDKLLGGIGQDRLFGAEGGDVIKGGKGNDKIVGGRDNDRLSGMDGSDAIFGGKGRDVLLGGASKDKLLGGAAKDTLSGGDGNDKLFGGHGNDRIFGGDGSDEIAGQIGQDRLEGGRGADTINGGKGGDTMLGDGGDDRLYGGNGADTLDGGEDDDLIVGGNGADVLTGGSGDDTLGGNLGRDTIYGDTGADVMSGHEGSDTLFGGADDDTLYGGSGEDLLEGGVGDDHLVGGLGADTFVFHAAHGADVITDFSHGEDSLQFATALWADEVLTDEDVIDRYASLTDDGVLFDFGDTSVLISAATDTAIFVDHMVFI